MRIVYDSHILRIVCQQTILIKYRALFVILSSHESNAQYELLSVVRP